MRAWLTLTAAELLAVEPARVAERLAYQHPARFGTLELAQRQAWETLAGCLRTSLGTQPSEGWVVHFEYDLLRLEKRIDAVLLTDRAIVVFEAKGAAEGVSAAALRQVEDYALDLHDFHAGSRAHPIVPVLVVPGGTTRPVSPPLIAQGVLPPMAADAASLGPLLADIAAWTSAAPRLDAAAWTTAAYRPVPTVLEAAAMLFDRHRSPEMRAARADAASLNRTVDAVRRTVAAAHSAGSHRVVFVTGIPGAGKTLCGLEVAFGHQARSDGTGSAAFLTGNSPLVEVLRADLLRRRAPAGSSPAQRDAARRVAGTVLQNVHRFLEDNATRSDPPAERLIVFDEAQRAWDASQATRDTLRRKSHLRMSEPAHTLDIMGRHAGWAVVVALIGNGQEINTGEAGLAEWGRVVAASPGWRATAPRRAIEAVEPTQRLASEQPPWLDLDDDLDLAVSVRSVRSSAAGPWVDAVLAGDVAQARAIARERGVPYTLTRDLDAARAALRALARGERRAGLVASSGARRLRADGLGSQVDRIAHWFLDRWPDVRSSEALEAYATEYDCQGLELDVVGLAWGADFRRTAQGWAAWQFRGTRWQRVRGTEEQAFVRNTYRVLLTRARYDTIIWVPRGSAPGPWADNTRDPACLDAIADYLQTCGVRLLSMPTAEAPEATTLL